MHIMELLEVIRLVGMTYGVGASTLAIIFYFKALEDGKVDASEHNFIDTVYFLLRVGMLILVVTEVFMIGIAYRAGVQGIPYLHDPTLWVRLMILAVLNTNAVLMNNKYMSWFIGTIVLGGSWTSYFLISLNIFNAWSFSSLLVFYILFMIVFGIILEITKELYLGRKAK